MLRISFEEVDQIRRDFEFIGHVGNDSYYHSIGHIYVISLTGISRTETKHEYTQIINIVSEANRNKTTVDKVEPGTLFKYFDAKFDGLAEQKLFLRTRTLTIGDNIYNVVNIATNTIGFCDLEIPVVTLGKLKCSQK